MQDSRVRKNSTDIADKQLKRRQSRVRRGNLITDRNRNKTELVFYNDESFGALAQGKQKCRSEVSEQEGTEGYARNMLIEESETEKLQLQQLEKMKTNSWFSRIHNKNEDETVIHTNKITSFVENEPFELSKKKRTNIKEQKATKPILVRKSQQSFWKSKIEQKKYLNKVDLTKNKQEIENKNKNFDNRSYKYSCILINNTEPNTVVKRENTYRSKNSFKDIIKSIRIKRQRKTQKDNKISKTQQSEQQTIVNIKPFNFQLRSDSVPLKLDFNSFNQRSMNCQSLLAKNHIEYLNQYRPYQNHYLKRYHNRSYSNHNKTSTSFKPHSTTDFNIENGRFMFNSLLKKLEMLKKFQKLEMQLQNRPERSNQTFGSRTKSQATPNKKPFLPEKECKLLNDIFLPFKTQISPKGMVNIIAPNFTSKKEKR